MNTKRYFSSCFAKKDMGNANVILGIKLIKNSNEIVFTQSHYIESFHRKFGYLESKLVSTPYDPSKELLNNDGKYIDQLKYSSITGSFRYAMIAYKTKYYLCCWSIK